MLIQLDPAKHLNERPTYRAVISHVYINKKQYTGVVQYNALNKNISVLLTDPYKVNYPKKEFLKLITRWYREGHDEPIQIYFAKMNLKYLSTELLKTFNLAAVEKIHGHVFTCDYELINRKFTKVNHLGHYEISHLIY